MIPDIRKSLQLPLQFRSGFSGEVANQHQSFLQRHWFHENNLQVFAISRKYTSGVYLQRYRENHSRVTHAPEKCRYYSIDRVTRRRITIVKMRNT
jgi:hypothetical protein